MLDPNFSFVKGSEIESRLSSEWVDAFDKVMPKWLCMCLPAYYTSKKRGVSFFEVSTIIDDWSHPERFKEDGFSYLLWEEDGISTMAFDAKGDEFNIYDWNFLMRYEYPHLYDGIFPDYMRKATEISDFSAYNFYFSRYKNCREPYNFIANRVREYFRLLTCDPDVTFSLGSRCYIVFDEAGKIYAGRHRSSYYG